jgi:hypothetical protein
MPDHGCPKCGGRMEAGRIYGDDGSIAKTAWSKKPARKGLLVYLGLVTDTPKDGQDVVVYRCGSCGYLESYAPPRS